MSSTRASRTFRARRKPAPALAYAVAVAAASGAVAVDFLVPPILARGALLPFLTAVTIAAWYGGARPGLLALALATVGSAYVLQIPTTASAQNALPGDVVRLLLFVAAGALACWLMIAMRETRDAQGYEVERARRSHAQLVSVLGSVPYPVAAVDASGGLLFSNTAAASFFRLSDPSQMGAALGALLTADGAPLSAPQEQGGSRPLALTGEVRHWQCRVRVGSQERFASVRATPILADGGAVDGLVLAWRDATEDRDAAVAREAFMGVLAHELRTPITTIYGGAHLLASRDERLPAETRREVAHDILHEATRLHRIADNLLVLSRVERGQLQVVSEPILLEPLVRTVVESEAIRWPATPFAVVVEDGTRTPASGAPGYVEQVLRNLLSNAAKYTPPGSPVTVHLERAGAGELVVRVLDAGPGFGAEDTERLFELYYRSPATATKAPGSGIGLYVCRRLMEAMGGRIWARCLESGGAEFGFALPLTADEGGACDDDAGGENAQGENLHEAAGAAQPEAVTC